MAAIGALETLLDRHADRVHAVCRRMLGNREDALDATQEALIAVRGRRRHRRRRRARTHRTMTDEPPPDERDDELASPSPT